MDLKLPRGRRRTLLIALSSLCAIVGFGNLALQMLLSNGSVASGVAGALVLGLLMSILWTSFLRSTITLEGSSIRKQFLRTTTYDLDSLVEIRVIGDANGGVVLQARWNDKVTTLSLPLLRNDHVNGMHSLASDAFETLANALDVVDLRDDGIVGIWPKSGDTAHVERVMKSAQLTRAGVGGRSRVAELLRSQAEYMRQNSDLQASPIAGLRFTSALIAAAMAAAHAPMSRETPVEAQPQATVL